MDGISNMVMKDSCKFEHPAAVGQGQGHGQNRHQNSSQGFNQFQNRNQNQNSNVNQNPNRFDLSRASNNSFNASNNRMAQGRGGQQSNRDSYGLTPNIIREDLRNERPQWIMSAYGPGKDAPIQLFGGFPLEQSFEEIRTQHYLAVMSGNLQQSIAHEGELAAQANQQVQNALKDLRGAIQYIQNGTNTHPNRLDICATGSNYTEAILPSKQPNEFATQSIQFSNTISAANQPQPGGFGQNSVPPLSQNTSLGPSSVFNGSFASSSFNAPHDSASTTHFNIPQNMPTHGVSNNFQAPGSHFAQPSVPLAAVSNFGQASKNIETRPFGGLNTNMGIDTTNDSTQARNSPFRQLTTAFDNGPISKQTLPVQIPIIIDQQSNSTSTGLPGLNVGRHEQHANNMSSDNFLQPNETSSSFPTSGRDLNHFSTRDANNRLTSWKGRPVNYLENTPRYQRNDGGWERIWFPDGPSISSMMQFPMIENPSEKITQAYGFVNETGNFRDGVIPEISPLAAWTAWDI